MKGFRSGIVVALGLLTIAPTAQAQIFPGGIGDFGANPFNSYYGFYIPQQQTRAVQQAYSSSALLNLNAAERRASALTYQRADTLRGPGSIYDLSTLEEQPFVRPPTTLRPGQSANVPRTGGYFGRTGSQFFGLRSGAPGSVEGGGRRVPVRSFGRARGGGFGGGGFGRGGMGGGGFGGGGFGGGGFGGGRR